MFNSFLNYMLHLFQRSYHILVYAKSLILHPLWRFHWEPIHNEVSLYNLWVYRVDCHHYFSCRGFIQALLSWSLISSFCLRWILFEIWIYWICPSWNWLLDSKCHVISFLIKVDIWTKNASEKFDFLYLIC